MKTTKTLKKNYQFRNVLRKGKYYSGKYIEIFVRKNNLNVNFIGIAIGVKVAKAVKRNKIKRLIRENYKLIEKDLKKGQDIVFLWKKKVDIKNASFKNIKEDMIRIFKRANILEEN